MKECNHENYVEIFGETVSENRISYTADTVTTIPYNVHSFTQQIFLECFTELTLLQDDADNKQQNQSVEFIVQLYGNKYDREKLSRQGG